MKQLFAVLLLLGSAYAGDVTVSLSGLATAWNSGTIGAGQNCAPTSGWRPAIPNVGLCIHISDGSFSSNIALTRAATSGAKIVAIADNLWGPLLSGAEIDFGSNVSWGYLEGVQFTGPSRKFAILYNTFTNMFLEYNYFHDFNTVSCNSTTDKNGVVHATTAPMLNMTINGNIMRHFGSSSCGGGSGFHGFYIDAAGLIFTNNVISGGTGGWGLQKQYASVSDCTPGIISGNTIFNNQGGIVLNDEGTSNGVACGVNHWTVANNIIVNNGVGGTGGGGSAYGIDFFHTSHAPQTLVTNNLIYGNLPANINCGTGGCPAVLNPKTDSGTAQTFTNFVADTNAAPIASGSFSLANYMPLSGSSANNGGNISCASGGLTPCAPSADISRVSRNATTPTIGALEIAATGAAVSHVSLTPLPFPSTNVGVTSAVLFTTVTNTGSSNFTITAITTTGTNAGDFPHGGTGTCNIGTVVTPGSAGCTISNVFSPSAVGAETATMSVVTTAPNSPQTVVMNGTGTRPDALLAPPNVSNIDDVSVDIGAQTCPEPFPIPTCLGQCWKWQHDTGTAGTSCGNSSRVASPSQDGQSRRFDLSWTGNGGERFSIPLTTLLDSTSTAFTYQTQFYVADLTHINQMEFDVNQVLPSGDTFIYGLQCNFAAGFWQYTIQATSTTSQWVSSTVPCAKPTSAAWHSLTLKSHRSGNTAIYDSVNLDGALSTFTGASGPSNFTLGWTPVGLILPNFQINGDNTANSTSAYLDQFSVSGSVVPFPTTTINTTSPVLIATLFNSGTGPMTIPAGAFAVTGPFAVGTDTCPRAPATLAAGNICQIPLTFSPLVAGPNSGTLTVTDDASSGTTQVLTLSGTGQALALPGNGVIISGGVTITGAVAFNPQ